MNNKLLFRVKDVVLSNYKNYIKKYKDIFIEYNLTLLQVTNFIEILPMMETKNSILNMYLTQSVVIFSKFNLIWNYSFNINIRELTLMPEFFLAFSAIIIIAHCSLVAYSKIYNQVLLQFSITSLCMLILFLTFILFFHDGCSSIKHFSLEFSFFIDALGFYSKIITIIISLISIYLIQDFIIDYKINNTEYSLLILYATLGLILLIAANDFVTIFLALELQSLSLYVLSGFKRNSIYSIESGLKYFLLGALSAGYFLLGWSFLYGISGLFILTSFHFFFFNNFLSVTENNLNLTFSNKSIQNKIQSDEELFQKETYKTVLEEILNDESSLSIIIISTHEINKITRDMYTILVKFIINQIKKESMYNLWYYYNNKNIPFVLYCCDNSSPTCPSSEIKKENKELTIKKLKGIVKKNENILNDPLITYIEILKMLVELSSQLSEKKLAKIYQCEFCHNVLKDIINDKDINDYINELYYKQEWISENDKVPDNNNIKSHKSDEKNQEEENSDIGTSSNKECPLCEYGDKNFARNGTLHESIKKKKIIDMLVEHLLKEKLNKNYIHFKKALEDNIQEAIELKKDKEISARLLIVFILKELSKLKKNVQQYEQLTEQEIERVEKKRYEQLKEQEIERVEKKEKLDAIEKKVIEACVNNKINTTSKPKFCSSINLINSKEIEKNLYCCDNLSPKVSNYDKCILFKKNNLDQKDIKNIVDDIINSNSSDEKKFYDLFQKFTDKTNNEYEIIFIFNAIEEFCHKNQIKNFKSKEYQFFIKAKQITENEKLCEKYELMSKLIKLSNKKKTYKTEYKIINQVLKSEYEPTIDIIKNLEKVIFLEKNFWENPQITIDQVNDILEKRGIAEKNISKLTVCKLAARVIKQEKNLDTKLLIYNTIKNYCLNENLSEEHKNKNIIRIKREKYQLIKKLDERALCETAANCIRNYLNNKKENFSNKNIWLTPIKGACQEMERRYGENNTCLVCNIINKKIKETLNNLEQKSPYDLYLYYDILDKMMNEISDELEKEMEEELFNTDEKIKNPLLIELLNLLETINYDLDMVQIIVQDITKTCNDVNKFKNNEIISEFCTDAASKLRKYGRNFYYSKHYKNELNEYLAYYYNCENFKIKLRDEQLATETISLDTESKNLILTEKEINHEQESSNLLINETIETQKSNTDLKKKQLKKSTKTKVIYSSNLLNFKEAKQNQYKIAEFALILILISFFFKLAIAPFHLWSIDIYENSLTSSTLFFAIVTKFSVVIIIIKICYYGFYDLFKNSLYQYITIVSITSIFIGSLGGLSEKKLKSLMAYSSINNLGYVLLCLSIGTLSSIKTALFYLIIYLSSSIAVWSCLISIQLKKNKYKKKQTKEFSDITLIKKTNPLLTISIQIALFSTAGLPPFIGFLTKMNIFLIFIESQMFLVSLITILLSIISTFYYLRLVKIMCFEKVLIGKLYKIIKLKHAIVSIFFSFFLIYQFLQPLLPMFFSYKIIIC